MLRIMLGFGRPATAMAIDLLLKCDVGDRQTQRKLEFRSSSMQKPLLDSKLLSSDDNYPLPGGSEYQRRCHLHECLLRRPRGCAGLPC